jgi:hypothetical protein
MFEFFTGSLDETPDDFFCRAPRPSRPADRLLRPQFEFWQDVEFPVASLVYRIKSSYY